MVFVVLAGHNTIAQRILLKIDGVTAPDGEEVRAVDFKVRATTSWSPGGSSVGKARLDRFILKKTNNVSSNELFKAVLTAKAYPVVTLEYYDASEVQYFTITLKDVFVSTFFWLSPECPTCLKLEHQIAFAAKQIETADLLTGETLRYNVSTNATY